MPLIVNVKGCSVLCSRSLSSFLCHFTECFIFSPATSNGNMIFTRRIIAYVLMDKESKLTIKWNFGVDVSRNCRDLTISCRDIIIVSLG